MALKKPQFVNILRQYLIMGGLHVGWGGTVARTLVYLVEVPS